MDLTKFQHQLTSAASNGRALPPVEDWNPDFCGDINLEIKLDGRWFYENSPIGRASLVKLFASVLKKEGDSYFLVTPVEKVGIRVEDVPFLVTKWEQQEGQLILTTQTDDSITLTNQAQLALRTPPAALQDTDATPIPYVKVRRNLWARLHQNVYYQLIDTARVHESEESTLLMIESSGTDFIIGTLPNT
ncbi:DUF1285 domain-containing protein [Alteromonas sp. KUL49]|uniref:DUF1285 domain-containing protein n=1 Tax=Alteromonas sp. KUL49 TaxID=2480798 RepID=UPI00102F1197|nr:DUF1285 domain-containing protein [Alteromonas sp. KUL49]TAP42123.1 DUF1285 domain-containing protein [Alteromonas sp. KUL49]GEA09705.1 hypothetical protein KUL49_00800 [Alteromonas sp. KUL49]